MANSLSAEELFSWIASIRKSSVELADTYAQTTPEERRRFDEILKLRQVFYMALPFATIAPHGTPSDYYIPNATLLNRATQCMRPGAGNYYARYLLAQPEGRHQCINRALTEILACMSHLGISVNKEHAFALIMGLVEPTNSLDAVIQRAGDYLIHIPTKPMTPENILATYESLVADLDIGVTGKLNDRLDEKSQQGTLASICDFVHNASEESDHPAIKALLAAISVQHLKPFPTINLLMARIIFSWAAVEVGLPIACYCPLVSFLNNWSQQTPVERGYVPRLPLSHAIIDSPALGKDWTPVLEEYLGFLAEDLTHFETRLMRLLMRRERVEHLSRFDSGLNERQRVILEELLLHEDAEFTYASAMETFDISYASAYADLTKLEARGFARAISINKATVFIAADDIQNIFLATIKKAAPDEYYAFYDDEGNLNETYQAQQEEVLSWYKKSLPPSGVLLQGKLPMLLPERSRVILNEGKKKSKKRFFRSGK